MANLHVESPMNNFILNLNFLYNRILCLYMIVNYSSYFLVHLLTSYFIYVSMIWREERYTIHYTWFDRKWFKSMFLFQVLPDFLVASITFLYVDNSLSVLFKLVLLSKTEIYFSRSIINNYTWNVLEIVMYFLKVNSGVICHCSLETHCYC